jgi:hypothetical protein
VTISLLKPQRENVWSQPIVPGLKRTADDSLLVSAKPKGYVSPFFCSKRKTPETSICFTVIGKSFVKAPQTADNRPRFLPSPTGRRAGDEGLREELIFFHAVPGEGHHTTK